MGRLQGKVAIVTGAAQGQGEATARLFAQEGATVILTDILTDKGNAVAKSIGEQAKFFSLDVRSEEQWSELAIYAANTYKRLDILINNAGLNLLKPIEEQTKADIELIFGINVTGPLLGIKAVLPQMKAQGAGSIVNISSVNGLRSNNCMSIYDSSKWAVRGLSKTLAIELGAYGIRVNSIHPGAIATVMINWDGQRDLDAMARDFKIPLGRVGQPAEVAYASLFLASDEASYVSGAELAVDGALTAGTLMDWRALAFA